MRDREREHDMEWYKLARSVLEDTADILGTECLGEVPRRVRELLAEHNEEWERHCRAAEDRIEELERSGKAAATLIGQAHPCPIWHEEDRNAWEAKRLPWLAEWERLNAPPAPKITFVPGDEPHTMKGIIVFPPNTISLKTAAMLVLKGCVTDPKAVESVLQQVKDSVEFHAEQEHDPSKE